jgi:hypothetical protein
MESLRQMGSIHSGGSWAVIAELVSCDSPALRRTLFRTVFAEIEAIAFGFKTFALIGHQLQQIKLSDAEVALVNEEGYALTDDGKARAHKAKIGFKQNLLFSLRMLAKAKTVDWSLPTDDLRWQSLCRSVRVRDRLVHQKLREDLEILDEELVSLAQGHDGFRCARGEKSAGEAPKKPGDDETRVRSIVGAS